MLSKNLETEINKQINRELYSAYLYLSMSAHFYADDLDGFGNWFRIQAQEERDHAMKFFDFVIDKGGNVELDAIEKPNTKFNSIKEIFELTLSHEESVTKYINGLMDLAIKENDHSVKSFLNWYVDEQVEEEATASKLLNQVKRIGDNPNAIIMMDKELASRQYTPINTNEGE